MVTTKEAVAFHEAGHAIVAAATGCAVRSATIVPDSDYSGQVLHQEHVRVDFVVATIISGPLAEGKRTGRIAGIFSPHGAHDLRRLQAYVDSLYQREVDLRETAEYLDGYALARRICDEHWPAIESLAYELLNRQTVSGKRIHSIFSQFRKDPTT